MKKYIDEQDNISSNSTETGNSNQTFKCDECAQTFNKIDGLNL